jgi:hypothetical protein
MISASTYPSSAGGVEITTTVKKQLNLDGIAIIHFCLLLALSSCTRIINGAHLLNPIKPEVCVFAQVNVAQ